MDKPASRRRWRPRMTCAERATGRGGASGAMPAGPGATAWEQCNPGDEHGCEIKQMPEEAGGQMRAVILTCAVTGEGPFNPKHPDFPVTPEQIARSALQAARAGAAVVHLHVRDPNTGEGSRDPMLFREVVERIRAADERVLINLSAGMGGDFCPDPDDESRGGPGTDIASAEDRLRH